MSNDIDFDQLIDLLDRALTSKDPKVMQALKKFLFIAALATEETEEDGPFKNILKRIEALEAQVNSVPYQWPPNATPTYPGPTWIGDSTSGTKWYNVQYPNVTMGGTGVGSTTTTYADTTTTFTMSDAASTLVDDTLGDLTKLQEQAREYLQKD